MLAKGVRGPSDEGSGGAFFGPIAATRKRQGKGDWAGCCGNEGDTPARGAVGRVPDRLWPVGEGDREIDQTG